ncbi:MAG TPA: transposase [Planctomycetaceae bacterium]|nr:transposase [Planctomycetaceae bacterium]
MRLDEEHHAKIVERQVNQMERSVIDRAYRGSGSAPYDPVALLKMVLFQYLKGNQSPATWHEEAKLNEAMQWLGRGYTPARRTWYDFRDRLHNVIEQLHEQIIGRALDEQHLNPTIGVQDGTAVAACASRHRTVTRATLDQRSAQLAKIIQGEFDGEWPRWVPPTEWGRLELAGRMKQASEVLTARIAKNARKPSTKRRDPGKIQVSLSDPMAPLGRDKLKVFRPLYTVQCMVAPGSHLIMSYCCEAEATDAGTLAPMIDKTQAAVRGQMKTVLADSGYCSIVDLQDCRQRDIELLSPVQANLFTESKRKAKPKQQISRDNFEWDPVEKCFRCPQGHRLDYHDRVRKNRHSGRQIWEYRYRCDPIHCGQCPLAKQCLRPGSASRQIKQLEDQELLDAQRKKMAAPQTQTRYRLRSQTVERAYADSKGNRRLTRFHGRGLSRARTETGVMAVAQNLLRLDRLERGPLTTVKIQT